MVKLAPVSDEEQCKVKIHYKHLTLMPTYTISRHCIMKKHRTVEASCHAPPQPVDSFDEVLTGTYYDILKVPRTATEGQIKTAFRDLSKIVHPDKNPWSPGKATRLFKQIAEPHECLTNQEKRMMYYQSLPTEQHRNAWHKTTMPNFTAMRRKK